MMNIDRSKSLEEILNELISDIDNVPIEKITSQYILKKREELVYSKNTYNSEADIGGYDTTGLTFMTEKEFSEEKEKADKFFDRILKK